MDKCLTGVAGCCACTEVGCCIWLEGSDGGCRGVIGWEGSGGVFITAGGRGILLGMWFGVEEGPTVELGVEGWGGTWACVWTCCCCCCWLTLGEGVLPSVGGAGGPEGSWEPSAFRGRLEFCVCWNKVGHTISILILTLYNADYALTDKGPHLDTKKWVEAHTTSHSSTHSYLCNRSLWHGVSRAHIHIHCSTCSTRKLALWQKWALVGWLRHHVISMSAQHSLSLTHPWWGHAQLESGKDKSVQQKGT